jgi:hypothetical protein
VDIATDNPSSVTNLITVATGGTFSGNVTLTASGLPTGITASVAGSGANSVTVTPSGGTPAAC